MSRATLLLCCSAAVSADSFEELLFSQGLNLAGAVRDSNLPPPATHHKSEKRQTAIRQTAQMAESYRWMARQGEQWV